MSFLLVCKRSHPNSSHSFVQEELHNFVAWSMIRMWITKFLIKCCISWDASTLALLTSLCLITSVLSLTQLNDTKIKVYKSLCFIIFKNTRIKILKFLKNSKICKKHKNSKTLRFEQVWRYMYYGMYFTLSKSDIH